MDDHVSGRPMHRGTTFFRNDFFLENGVRSLTGVKVGVGVRVRVVLFLIFYHLENLIF